MAPGFVDQLRRLRGIPDLLADGLLEIFTPAYAQFKRVRSGPGAVWGWLITRTAIVLALVFVKQERLAAYDVQYYAAKVEHALDMGFANALQEYPTPAAWIVWLPYALAGGNEGGYFIAFVAMMMVFDAAFTFALWRADGKRDDVAVHCWLLFVLLLGPIAYTRFDMLPCVLAGGAFIALRKWPSIAGALAGLGAAVKLWPALLHPVLSAGRSTRSRTTIGFTIAGVGLALASLFTAGFERLVSPLVWQNGRGLQIESVAATPAMIAHAIQPDVWLVESSEYHAYEVFGPGAIFLEQASNAATLGGLLFIGLLALRAFRNPDLPPYTVGMSINAIVLIMLATNKTLSPQYIVWLGAPLSALFVVRGTLSQSQSVFANRLGVLCLLLALFTHVLYPFLYEPLHGASGLRYLPLSTFVLATRNAAIVYLTTIVCREAWRALAVAPHVAVAPDRLQRSTSTAAAP